MKGCVLWAPVGAFSSDIWNEKDSWGLNDLQTLWRAGGCNLDNLVEEGHLIHQATAWVSFTTIIAYNWYDASPSPTLLKTYWRVEVPHPAAAATHQGTTKALAVSASVRMWECFHFWQTDMGIKGIIIFQVHFEYDATLCEWWGWWFYCLWVSLRWQCWWWC